MFLSRVEVAWRLARNPYELHRAVWRMFPETPQETRSQWEDDRAGFLFLVEESPLGNSARLLVQSRVAPTAAESDVRLLASREMNPKPQAGQSLAFVLTANPIKTIVDEQGRCNGRGDPKKCRVFLIREDEQRAWLTRKLGGVAEAVATGVQPHPPLYFRKGSSVGKVITVTFEGVLQVTDPNGMRDLLAKGVGPAKAFGCGLLLVRRLN